MTKASSSDKGLTFLSSLRVRRLLPPLDLRRVLKIQADCDWQDPFTKREVMAHYKLHSPEEGRSYVQRMYVAADERDEAKGFISFTTGKGLLNVNAVCVPPQYQRKGVASLLLMRLLLSRNPQCTRPGLFCGVRASSLPAQLLLKSVGIPCVGETKAAFSSPDENALVFLKWMDGQCPQQAREKVLELWSVSGGPRRS